MEDKINFIVRVGNQVVAAKRIDRPENIFTKDYIFTWEYDLYVVDYITQDTLAVQKVTPL